MIPKIIHCFWIGMSALALVSLAIGFRNGVSGATDFQWMPAKALLSGIDPYVAEVGGPTFACYAPSCLLLLTPWTLISEDTARVAWLVMNIVFMLAFLLVMCRLFVRPGERSKWLFGMTVLMFLSLPFRQLLECGQHIGFSLAFFSLALLCSRRGWWLVSGLCLIPAAFKYTSMIPLMCVFVMMGCWRELGVAILGHVLLTLLAALLSGTAPWVLILGSLRIGTTQTGEGIADLASLAAVLGCSAVDIWAIVGYAICLGGLICLCVRFRGMSHGDGLLPILALLATFSCCACYHRLYDFTVLLIVPFLMPRLCRGRWAVVLTLGWFFVGFRALAPFASTAVVIVISFSMILMLLAVLLVQVEKAFQGRVCK